MAVNQIINGNFQNIIGSPLNNGYLLFKLNQDVQVGNTQICSGRVIKVPLNSEGNIPSSPAYSFWPNSELTPDTSFYTVEAYTQSGQLVWGPYSQVIPSTPSPYDIGSWVPGDIY